MFWRRNRPESMPSPEEAREERLSAYLDDELRGAERAEVEALIASDANARAYVNDLRVMTAALGTLADVRAPRSFAIPVGAVAAARAPRVMFQRVEMAFRASAAAAALLFVVVLINDPTGDTPVVSPAAQMSTDAAAPASTLDAPAPADGSRAMPAPAAPTEPDETPPPGEATGDVTGALALPADDPADEPSDEDPPASEMATMTAPTADAPAGVPAEDALRSGTVTAFELMPAGTDAHSAASDGVGGMAPALGTLAALLTALSVLMAWDRRMAPNGRPDRE